MTDQNIIICVTCDTSYGVDETHCPICGEANPLLTEDLLAAAPEPEVMASRHWFWGRSGCVILLLFILFFVLVSGGVLWGGYEGLQERIVRTQAEIEGHYQQALEHVEADRIDLAIAELELTLSLDPTHNEARETLAQLKENQAQILAASEETASPTGQPTLDRTDDLFAEAKAQTLQGNWAEAIELLTEIRQDAPGYKIDEISEALYNANYEYGLRLISEGKFSEAVAAFDEALVEKPDDPIVTAEWEKVTLYLSLASSEGPDYENNIIILNRIYEADADFADVTSLLFNTYKEYADYLSNQKEWCAALPRYQEANQIRSSQQMEALVRQADVECERAKQALLAPTPISTTPSRRANPTPTVESTSSIAGTADLTPANRGALYFARLNRRNSLWEIRALSVANGVEEVILSNGTQPAISRNGRLLAYQSQLNDSLGLHIYNMSTGEDVRVTTFAEDILPKWNQRNSDFVFNSQRAGDRRWQVMIGFADGKGDAVVLLDGRTPSSAANSDIIAYQGTDPQGNNPGIYLISRQGGEARRLTTDESDRSPAISSTGRQIAFMSTRNGNWDIWTITTTGGSARRLTTSATNDGLPVWSPDGSQIAFVSDRGGSWGIYVMDASGGAAKKVADWGDHPDWLLAQISWGP